MAELIHVPYDVTVRLALASLERNLLPDAVVRRFTRLLLASRLRSGYKNSSELQLSDLLHFVHCKYLSFSMCNLLKEEHVYFEFGGLSSLKEIELVINQVRCNRYYVCSELIVSLSPALREMPIAIKTDQPKAQHYELPTSFFKLVLGNNLKYRYKAIGKFYFLIHTADICMHVFICVKMT